MSQRHLVRSVVLQTLFERDFNREITDFNLKEALKRNMDEFAPGLEDRGFAEELLDTIDRKEKVIDEIITKAAPEWPIEKINVMDRNVLRIGLAELLFGDRANVPPKVAINEAIELAKSFGGEKSGKFINGVLGAVYKELGEPGKDDTGRKKVGPIEDIPDEMTPIEHKAGGVAFARHDGTISFALVHDVFGYWTLAKGTVEEGETAEEAAIRETKEEIGLDVKISGYLDETTYVAFDPEKGKIRKNVKYFLLEGKYGELHLHSESGGLTEAKWFSIDELENITTYGNIYTMLAKAIELLTKI